LVAAAGERGGAAALRKVFEPARAASERNIVGHICTISSGKVDGTFGTATISDGGAACCSRRVRKDNKLTEGDRPCSCSGTRRTRPSRSSRSTADAHEVEALKDPATARSVIESRVKGALIPLQGALISG